MNNAVLSHSMHSTYVLQDEHLAMLAWKRTCAIIGTNGYFIEVNSLHTRLLQYMFTCTIIIRLQLLLHFVNFAQRKWLKITVRTIMPTFYISASNAFTHTHTSIHHNALQITPMAQVAITCYWCNSLNLICTQVHLTPNHTLHDFSTYFSVYR